MRDDIPDGSVLHELNKSQTVYQLAKIFNCHHQSIQSRIRSAGYEPILVNDKRTGNQNRLPDSESLAILYQTMTSEKIAEMFGVTTGAIAHKFKRSGVDHGHHRPGPRKKKLPSVDELESEIAAGASRRQLARKYGVSLPTILRRLKQVT